ncbi:unnamed protein product [Rhizophagus irregularis]|nr:unnamed protein product [Rhizophagus irregularis]
MLLLLPKYCYINLLIQYFIFKFYLPTEDEINYFKKKPRVVNIDKPTENWVHQFENFSEKAGFTDGKMKYVAEQGKANVQGVVEECKKIQYSPALNIDTPTGLLKKANGQGFDVNIPQSKTNQRGINGSLNDEKLRIPYHPMIMETYNKYFSKRPGNADKEFYLREYVAEDDYIIYNHWFQKFHVGEK